jgi:hypothetical protein
MNNQILNSKSFVIVFTYAPAGLGHLRVTDTLYHGLKIENDPILMGSHDRRLTFVHQIISITPWGQYLYNWVQQGRWQENIMTFLYRYFLRNQTELIYNQMLTILAQRLEVPEYVLVVSTHFGLAHQLASIKNKLEKVTKIRLFLILQVTDDSPQPIWYVPGADIIFVPSERTKHLLQQYGKTHNLAPVNFEVIPYPINPLLSERSNELYKEREKQLDITKKSQIHIAIPISGGAVGLDYVAPLIDRLHHKSNRFVFHIISKISLFTQTFLTKMLERPYVKTKVSSHDRGIVSLYEKAYHEFPISLEITKPSEQAFKALFDTKQVGGSLLLFSHPVGRQEFDNIEFLRRHHLLPSAAMKTMLYNRAKKNEPLTREEHQIIHAQARHWRALEIPWSAAEGADFIWWCYKEGIFATMLNYTPLTKGEKDTYETSPDGVKQFWMKVNEYLDKELHSG